MVTSPRLREQVEVLDTSRCIACGFLLKFVSPSSPSASHHSSMHGVKSAECLKNVKKSSDESWKSYFELLLLCEYAGVAV